MMNIFRRRFNTRGELFSIYGGLLSAVGLVFFSPTVSGTETSLITGMDFAWFPLNNPGLVSIPLGFLFGVIGTLSAREPAAEDRYTELEVRALTGAGSEKAISH